MTAVAVLGCGFHGRGIAYHLARSGRGLNLSVGDRDARRAASVGRKIGVPWRAIDVTDRGALREVLGGVDVVVNAVGPYHRTALGVVGAAVDLGIHYVDMNDDHDVAEALLHDPTWDERAQRAGVTILIDCGVVPGLSGMLVRYANERLDRTERIAIRFAWNYGRAYPAAIQHFLRINTGDGPQFVDGRHVRMGPLEGREDVDFQEPVGRTGVYFTGIPDPVAIARFVPGVREATAKGAFYQAAANRLVEDMVRWGFTSYEPPVPGSPSPFEFLMTYLASPRGAAYFEIPRRELPLAVRVEVEGTRSGRAIALRYEAHDHARRATTTFTALAALAVAEGRLEPGVTSPEAWADPASFLRELLTDQAVRILEWRDGEPPQPMKIRTEG